MCGKFILLETRIIENSCSIFDLAQDFGLGLGNGEHKARFAEMVGHVRSSRKIGSGQSGLRPRRHVLPLPPSLLLFACAKRSCDRSGVVRGMSVSVSVGLGCIRIKKKK